jgi:DNA-3-methyladenine glycosylase I
MDRCQWCLDHPLYIQYHDLEWGVPLHDDRKLFEFLILETFQAGLSWLTVLKKRENFRRAFAGFDPEVIAAWGEDDTNRLLTDGGIIRNRQKIKAALLNARAFLKIRESHGSFDSYIWDFVDGSPIVNHWRTLGEIPAHTPLAEKISKNLKQAGFSFVGPTVIYAHMQATGMVNDHLVSCFRHAEVQQLS